MVTDALLLERAGKKQLIKTLEEEIKEIDSTIMSVLILDHNGEAFETDAYTISLVEFHRETLTKTKLLEAGVTLDQIVQGTTVTPVIYPKVTPKAKPATPGRKKK